MKHTLYIIRGLPGSGKSTLARKLVAPHRHHESDTYFLNIAGEYNFNPSLLPAAHKWCAECVQMSINMNEGDIAVSNTFTRKWEYQPYIDMAVKGGYNVQIVECTSSHGSIHNVPKETIDAMRLRWEPHS